MGKEMKLIMTCLLTYLLVGIGSLMASYPTIPGGNGIQEWEPAKDYTGDTLVWERLSDNIYRSIVPAHTSSPTFAGDEPNWVEMSDDLNRLLDGQGVHDAVAVWTSTSGDDVRTTGVFIDIADNMSGVESLAVVSTGTFGGDLDTLGNLSVFGSSIVNGNSSIDGTLGVTLSASIGGNLDVTGTADIIGDTSIGGNLDVTGTADIIGNTTVGGTLDVTGVTHLKDDLFVDGNLDVSGTTSLDGLVIDGSLDVSGTTSLTGTVNIEGPTNLIGDVLIDGSLEVSGSTEVDSLDVDGTLDVTGTASFLSNVDIDGALTVSESAALNSTLSVLGVGSFSIDLNVDGSVNVTGSVDSIGNISTLGQALVDGGLNSLDIATPITPTTGRTLLYTKADGKLYKLNDIDDERLVGLDLSSTVDNRLIVSSGIDGDSLEETPVTVDPATGEMTLTGNIYIGDSAFLEGALDLTGLVSITTPTSGRYKLFFKDDGNLYSKNDVGVESVFENSTPNLVAYVLDEKSTNTDGQTLATNSWDTRDVNTLVGASSFLTITSNQIIIDAGTYHVTAATCQAGSGVGRTRFRNITEVSDEFYSLTVSGDNVQVDTLPLISQGVLDLTVTTTFELQHRVNSSLGSQSGGPPSNISGIPENYTTIKIEKVD